MGILRPRPWLSAARRPSPCRSCAGICLRDVDGFLQGISVQGGTRERASHVPYLGLKVWKGWGRDHWQLTGLWLLTGLAAPTPQHSCRSGAGRAGIQSWVSCISKAAMEGPSTSQFFPARKGGGESLGPGEATLGFQQTKLGSSTGPFEKQRAGPPRLLSGGRSQHVLRISAKRTQVPVQCRSGQTRPLGEQPQLANQMNRRKMNKLTKSKGHRHGSAIHSQAGRRGFINPLSRHKSP